MKELYIVRKYNGRWGGGGAMCIARLTAPIALVNFFVVISKCVAHVSDTSICTP